MNRKGFTLVELLAVIILLGVLSLMIAPNILGTRKSVVKQTFENKLSSIYDAAGEYAADNLIDIPKGFVTDDDYTYSKACYSQEFVDNMTNDKDADKYSKYVRTGKSDKDLDCNKYCMYVLVRALINKGYLVGDAASKSVLTNPLDGSSLNNQVVCIRYDSEDPLNRKIVSYIIGEDKLYAMFK